MRVGGCLPRQKFLFLVVLYNGVKRYARKKDVICEVDRNGEFGQNSITCLKCSKRPLFRFPLIAERNAGDEVAVYQLSINR